MYKREERDNFNNSAKSSLSRSRSKSKLFKLAQARAAAEAEPHEGIIGQMSRFERQRGASPPRMLDGSTSPSSQRYQYSYGRNPYLNNTVNPTDLQSSIDRLQANRSPRGLALQG